MILYKNLKPLRIGGTPADLIVTRNGSTLIFQVKKPEDSTEVLNHFMFGYLSVSYNGEVVTFTGDGRASIPYEEGVDSMKLRCTSTMPLENIFYDGVYYGTVFPISWHIPAAEPACTFAPVSIHEDYANRLTWTFTAPEGIHCAAAELWYYEKSEGASSFTATKLFSAKNTENRYVHTIPAGAAGKQCRYRLVYCGYSSEYAAVDQYITIGEAETEIFTIGETQKYPVSPTGLVCGRPAAGGRTKVEWTAASDPYNEITAYTLERQINGGSWKLIYHGSSTAFTDSIPVSGADTVTYRVRSADAEGDVSAWVTGAVLPVIRSNLYVMHGGVLRPAAQVYIGGVGAAGALAYVG